MASLTPLDLAALLCSRVCHDVISPVGAIVNGLEVLEGEQDDEMRAVAMELIKKSAISASARLQFCRLAFGAAGSFGASIDTGDAEKVARDIFASDRTTLLARHPAACVAKLRQAVAQSLPYRRRLNSPRRRHHRRPLGRRRRDGDARRSQGRERQVVAQRS